MVIVYIFVFLILYINPVSSIGGINELKSLTGNRPYMGYGNPTYEERLSSSQYYVPRNNLYSNGIPYRAEMTQDYTQNVYSSGMFPYPEMVNNMRYMNVNQYNGIPSFSNYNSINNPYGSRFYKNFDI